MIATLKFTLPREQAELQTALKAQALASALCAIRERVRSWKKYGGIVLPDMVPHTEEGHVEAMLELFAAVIHQEIDDNGLQEILDE